MWERGKREETKNVHTSGRGGLKSTQTMTKLPSLGKSQGWPEVKLRQQVIKERYVLSCLLLQPHDKHIDPGRNK